MLLVIEALSLIWGTAAASGTTVMVTVADPPRRGTEVGRDLAVGDVGVTPETDVVAVTLEVISSGSVSVTTTSSAAEGPAFVAVNM